MNQYGSRISARDAYIIENLYTCNTGSLRQHVHVFTNKFYGKDGVCLALLERLMTNIRSGGGYSVY